MCVRRVALCLAVLGARLGGVSQAQRTPAATARAAPRLDTLRFESPKPGMFLTLVHAHAGGPGRPDSARIVLFAEGSGVATAGNAAFRIDGSSWMDDLAARGYDVWSLDYLGYGASDRYPATTMDSLHGTAADCAPQVVSAARFILRRQHADRLSLIGDSFGTLVAGLAATEAPELFRRLVLFAPVTPATSADTGAQEPIPAYDLATPLDVWTAYRSWLPPGTSVLDSGFWARTWGPVYLATDPAAAGRQPPSVLVPSGPDLDVRNVSHGRFPFDPRRITTPTLVLWGEWDAVATTAGALRLFDALTAAPWKRSVLIGRGTHLIQFEAQRGQAYREVDAFLAPDSPRETP